jgi:hypothetical protein
MKFSLEFLNAAPGGKTLPAMAALAASPGRLPPPKCRVNCPWIAAINGDCARNGIANRALRIDVASTPESLQV